MKADRTDSTQRTPSLGKSPRNISATFVPLGDLAFLNA